MLLKSPIYRVAASFVALAAVACSGAPDDSSLNNDYVGVRAAQPRVACTEDVRLECPAGLTQACSPSEKIWACAIASTAPASLAGKWVGKAGDTNGFFGSIEFEVAELLMTETPQNGGFHFRGTFDDGFRGVNVTGWYTIEFDRVSFHFQSDHSRVVEQMQVVTLDHFTDKEFMIRSLKEPEVEVGKFERFVSDEQLDDMVGW